MSSPLTSTLAFLASSCWSMYEFFQFARVGVCGLHVLGQRFAGKVAKFGVAHLGARRADDAGRIGKLVVELTMIQRRQQLALGKVAGTAKDDEIKRVDGDDLACHRRSIHMAALI
jgi:hypothetical protein